jgi:PKD repeat protein
MRRVEVVQPIFAVSAGTLSLLAGRDSMRSNRLLAVATGVLMLGSACGGDGPPGGVDENEAPVADFAPPSCTVAVVCNFTSTSTDDGAVTTWSWDFDGAGTGANVTTAAATHTFAAEGSFPVSLTVGDAEGLTHSVTKNVTVAAVPAENVPPTADFDLPAACVAGTPCGFHSTSTDTDGDIATAAWEFGEGGVADGSDATHTYAAAGTFTVKLTVTDDDGASAFLTQDLTVTAAASQDCTTAGVDVDCLLTVTERSTVTFTVVSVDCDFSGNRLNLTGPVVQTIFVNLCNRNPGDTYTLRAADGISTLVLEAGTEMAVRFHRGTPAPTDPPASDPGVQVDGVSPTWTLNIDDGGLAGAPGEPDFNDAVVTVQATAAP